jgi:hypothetical protein
MFVSPTGFFMIIGGLLLSAGMASEPPPGFETLFNGKDLTGWRGGDTFDHLALMQMPDTERAARIAEWTASLTEINHDTGKPHWRSEQGILVNDGLGGFLTTEEDFGDFELLVDYRMESDTDSGIYLRGVPQVQIWDPASPDPDGSGNDKGSGGLWNNSVGAPGREPLMLADRPSGEWNHFRILMMGNRVSVWLNDQFIVDHAVLENFYDRKLPPEQRRPIPEQGPIQLQTHGGEIYWKNLYIRGIGPEEAGRIHALDTGIPLVSGNETPLQSKAVIDGTEPGWTMLGSADFGDVNGYEDTWVWQGDVLHCSGQPVGVLRTKKQYTNFEYMVEWRHMQSGGNSGTFVWVTEASLQDIQPGQLPRGGIEVQILDHGYHALYEARKGKRGEFFSTHGDVFAVGTSTMKPFPPLSPNGERSFPRFDRSRGVGEWNHYYVRALNGEVRLWVNGVEVSGGTECEPRQGYLCLESEGAPVEFRNIRIRELPRGSR